MSTPRFPQRQPLKRWQRQGPSRGSSLPTSRPSFLPLRTTGPTTAGLPPSAMTSTPPRLLDSQDPRMVPALGMRRSGRQPRPWRRRAAERRRRWRRWGCDARASPGSGRVGRRGRINPHHAGGPGGGAAEVMCHRPPAGHLRSRALAMQDFQTSAAKHRPSSPMLEGILTLKSFMIPHPKLCDLPADIAGGWVMISWALSWPLSCLIS